MLRQILQALRFAVADFFDVPWQLVLIILGAIVVFLFDAYVRTVAGPMALWGLRTVLTVGAYFVLRAAFDSYSQRR